MDRRRDFVNEYQELCKKHGFYVRSYYCCCGGSDISPIPSESVKGEDQWDYEAYMQQSKDFDEQLNSKK